MKIRFLSFLALGCALAALLAGVHDATAQQPLIYFYGKASGGEIHHDGYYPQVRQVFAPSLGQDVTLEAMSSPPLVYSGFVVNGYYSLTADLPGNQLRLQAVAPTYTYLSYLDAFGNFYDNGINGGVQALIDYYNDQITVYGPFPAGARVTFTVRARLEGTLQAGPAGQGYEGKVFKSYVGSGLGDVGAKANVFASMYSSGAGSHSYSAPASGAAAGGPAEIFAATEEITFNALATVAGQTPPFNYPGVQLGVGLDNGASADVRVSFEIVLPRGYSASSLFMGDQLRTVYANAQPSFTDAGDVSGANTGPQTISNWATASNPGVPDEASQVLSFVVTANSNPNLFNAGPAISPDGTLTFTPVPGSVGSAQLTVVLRDDGGLTAGGIDTSVPHTFIINVTGVDLPPTVTSVRAESPYQVLVQWSEPVTAPSATTPANYVLGGGLGVSSATLVNPTTVRLSTSRQEESTTYTLRIQGVQDTTGNAAQVDTLFRSLQYVPGQVRLRTWPDNAGVFSAFASENIAGRPPTRDETRPGYFSGEGLGDIYFGQLRGWFTPDVAGNYVFFCASDDDSELYLSTDDNPANRQKIASVPGWTGTREWNKYPQQRSVSIPLQAGQRYYLELVWREGAAGDHGEVAVKPATGVDPVNGNGELGGDRVGDFVTSPPNNPPVAVDEIYTTDEDAVLNVPSQGVLANDTDPDGDPLTVTLLNNSPAHAALFALYEDGSFAYLPATNYFGPDSFTYTVSDGHGGSSSATVTITVTPVNDAPSFVSVGLVTGAVNSGMSWPGWATAISTGPANEAGQSLSFVVTGNSNPSLFLVAPVISPDGRLSFTPAPNTVGTAQVAVVLKDDSGTAAGGVDTSTTHTFTIRVNSAPVARSGGPYIINQGDTLLLNASGSFEPDAGDTIVAYFWDMDADGWYGSAGEPRGVTPSVTPAELAALGLGVGTHTIRLKVYDNYGFIGDDSTTLTINSAPVNLPPVAANDAHTTDEDHVLMVGSPGLLANDTDPDAGPLVRFRFAGHMLSADADFNVGDRFTGFYSLDPAAVGYDHPDSTLNFQYPTQNAPWELSFPDTGYKFSGNLTIVSVGNDTAFGDRYVATLGAPASVGVALPSGRPMSLAQFDLQDRVAAGADMLQDDSVQTTTVNLTSAQDAAGRFLFIGNTQPQLTLDRLDGPMSVTQVNGQAAGVNTPITLASGATLRVNSNGSYSYDPRGHFDSLPSGQTATETFTYEMSDADGATASATVTITINGLNDAPMAANVIGDQSAVYGVAFGLTIPANTFSDADAAQPLTYIASGMPPGIVLDGGTGILSGAPTAVGTFAITVTASDEAVPPLSASTTFNLVVGKAALTVTADEVTRFYGEANPPLTGMLVSVVNGDNITASYSTTAEPGSVAGVYTIYPALNDPDNRLGNYNVTVTNGALRINPVNQTITFGAIPAHTYGDAPFALNATSSSGMPLTFVSASPSVVTISGNMATIVGAGEGFLIAYQFGGGGYLAANPVGQAVTVAKAPLTVRANDRVSAYGSEQVLSASYTGFVNGDTMAVLTTPVTLTTPATAASIVGTYPITPSAVTAVNYDVSFVPGTLTISPAILTVTADNKGKVYGAALPALTLSYAGFVNGDSAAVLTQVPAPSTMAKKASMVGDYPITLTGGAAANYQITPVNGTLSVIPAPLTVTAANKSNVYGTALPALTATYAGFVNGDNAASLDTPATLSTSALTNSPVGTYPIIVGGAADVNYAISFVNATLTVTPRNLTITAQNKTKIYGAALPALTAGYSGLAPGETAADLDVPPFLDTSATPTSNVGNYPITVSGASDPNYTITLVNGTLTVNQAALTVRAANKSKTYGASVPALTYTITGLVNGDTEASLDTPVAITTTGDQSSPVATYPIVVSGASDANYRVTFANGTLTVSKAPLTIKAQNATKIYGAALPTLPVTYTGFVLGENESVLTAGAVIATTATPSSNAGNYPVTVNGATAVNYTISFQNGTLAVSKAPLTITADNKTKTKGTANPAFTASYAGFVNGDTVASLDTAVAFSTTATTSSPVGSYPITPKTAKDVNYTVTFVNGTLSVTP